MKALKDKHLFQTGAVTAAVSISEILHESLGLASLVAPGSKSVKSGIRGIISTESNCMLRVLLDDRTGNVLGDDRHLRNSAGF